ncbi:MAG TPA: peptidyl-prolyl cis-trans isomerase [Bryobacteraceae bacterium]|jgi:peptidyl-prolyl cis-trans isomerase D|nr:peptidyl-prolyl cis-trans isomerase [Bryobacteraceae bacterium]
MFDLFRSRDKMVRGFLTVLLGLVALSMVTYLIPQTGMDTGTGDTAVVANIDGDKLTAQEVTQTIQRLTQNSQIPSELLSIYAPQVIQQAINERVMVWKAGEMGMKVSSDEAENAIIDSLPPAAVKDGKVDSAMLAQVLQSQGTTLAALRTNMQRQMLISRLEALVAGGVVVTGPEIEKEYHKRNDKVKVQYAVLATADFQKEAEPTDAEIQSWYDAHKSEFMVPDKRSLAVIVLDPVKIGAGIQITDAQLQKAYRDQQSNFQLPERVQARHILLKSDASNDAAVKAKAEDILKQIRGGADFAKLATEKSEDPGSAQKGGELGWIVRGQTVPEFEKAAFSLKPGETSGLVKTEYGYHIIQVEAHEQAHLQPFDEVKTQLAAQLQKEAAAQLMQKLTDQAIDSLRKDPSHPEKTAQAVGGALVNVPNIQANDPIPGIGVSKELYDAVSVLKKFEVTLGPVVLPDGRALVADVTDVVPAHQGTLDEVRDKVRTAAMTDKENKILLARAEELASKAQSMGGDLEKAAKSMNIAVKTSNDVTRNDALEGVGNAGSFPGFFQKPAGSLVGPVGVPGGQMVAKILTSTPADISGLAAQRQKIADDLHQQKTQQRATFFQQGLRQSMIANGDLKINQDVIDRIVASFRTTS